MPRIGERQRNRHTLPGELVAATDATGDNKSVIVWAGVAILPHFVVAGVTVDADTHSKHLPAPPVLERSAVA